MLFEVDDDTTANRVRSVLMSRLTIEDAANAAHQVCPDIKWQQVFAALVAAGLVIFEERTKGK